MTPPDDEATDPLPRGLPGAIGAARQQWRRADHYVRSQLTWNRVYRASSYVNSALWIVPFFAILLVLVVAPPLRWLDTWLGWRLAGLRVAGASALYQTIITLTLSFMVFTFGSLLVAIQIAGGQLTPRIIATTLLRDPVVKYSVGLFVFSLIFSVMALDRLEGQVHELIALVAAILGIASIATFLFLIDYAARLLRPISIVTRVAREGAAVIAAVYPDATDRPLEGAETSQPLPDDRRTVAHEGASEIVLAVDLGRLVGEAAWTRGIVEFVPQVGDFVATGEPLFVLYGGATAIEDRRLRTMVAFGSERTMEQDPLFAFRILVDIALKALSPAINDPTTAVLAIDQIHRLLRAVGRRQLRSDTIRDNAGERRVILRTPGWEDFVHLSCVEIRGCGVGNVQVTRRLLAMFANLIASLPAYRHRPIEEERDRLLQGIGTAYALPDDRALASIPDSQGLGGAARRVPERDERHG